MPKNIPEYLKLHVEDVPAQAARSLDELSSVDMLCCAFERATGWHLRYENALEPSPRGGASAAENGAGLVLAPAQRADDERFPRLPREEVEHLATAIAVVLGELDRTRTELSRREAELAAGVPVTIRPDEEQHLALRLESSLEAATQAVGAQAAALYLLDDGTSELKLRSSFGLPRSRMLEAPRPLRGAMADLEALLGHAVVIEDTDQLPHWRCPELCPSAMCVPVSTASTPLGTLWIYSETPRDFTPAQTNMVEVVAGRIAADLEREMLLVAGVESKTVARDLHEASRWQQEHLPSIAPLVDDWDLAGAMQNGGELASEFFDWSVLADGHLAIALGDAHGRAVAAGLSAAALQAAVKAHAGYRHDSKQMLERVNETLWMSSPGGQFASLGYALISPEKHEAEFAGAGRLGALLVQADGHTVLARTTPPLGSDPDFLAQNQQFSISPGGVLLLVSDGVLASTRDRGQVWDEAALAEFVRRHLHLSPQELVARLEAALGPATKSDRTLLVAKRMR